MRAVFRADAGDVIGHGHVMRCLTLAEELRRREIDCLFVCRAHEGHLAKQIEQRGFGLQLLPVDSSLPIDRLDYPSWVGASQEQDARETLVAIGGKTDFLIVDHYGLDQSWERKVRKSCRKLLVIDDLADRQHDADLLLDSGIGKTADNYRQRMSSDARFLCGPSFALLARKFAELRSATLLARQQRPVRKLLMFIGGGNSATHIPALVPKLADVISEHALELEIILGTEMPDIAERVEEALAQTGITASVSSLVDNMPEKLSTADLAVGAAGGSAFERACLGLPAVILKLAENQSAQLQALAESNAAIVIENVDLLSQALYELINRREEIQAQSTRLCDGLGATRVVDALLEINTRESGNSHLANSIMDLQA